MIKTTTRNLLMTISLLLTSILTFGQVANGADSGPGSLRQAVIDANLNPGPDFITINPGLTITLTSGTINLTDTVFIFGNGSTVDGTSNSDRAITAVGLPGLSQTLSLDNLNFSNNTVTGNGGAISSSNMSVFLNLGIYTNNTAAGMPASGGAVYIEGPENLDVIGTQFIDNTATRAGGAIETQITGIGLITIEDVIFTSNTATGTPGNGGGLHITGTTDATITGGSATNNIAANEGGAFWNGSGIMTINTTSITANEAQGNDADSGGGALYNEGGTLTINPSVTISGNSATGTAGSGGGILSNGGILNIDGITVSGNTANRAGGGIEVRSMAGDVFAFNNLTLDGNMIGTAAPGNGGGYHISGAGDSTFTNATITNNTAVEGGGLWNGAGIMTVTNTSVSMNEATGASAEQGGGGLYNDGGTLIVDALTLIDMNTATGASGSGGGILSTAGTVTLTGTTITNNSSNRAGGGIEIAAGTLMTTDITLSTNTTNTAPGNGGGLHVGGGADSTITGGTVDGNIAGSEGGGLWNSTGTMIVNGVAVTNNIANGVNPENGGAGIYNDGGTLTIGLESNIASNQALGAAGSGGGILSVDGLVTLNDITLQGNQAIRAGGAIEIIDGTLDITDVIFSSNFAFADPGTGLTANPGNGGAIHVTGTDGTLTTISGSIFTNNRAFADGGALWNQTGSTMIVNGNSTFGGLLTDNLSNIAFGFVDGSGGGGAIYNNGGTLTIEDSIFDQNIASGTSGSGGSILSTDGDVIITDVSFDGGSAVRAGGAIEIIDGTLTTDTVNFSNNTTVQEFAAPFGNPANPGNGGAIHVTGTATVDMTGGFVNSNIGASEGGGLWNQAGATMTINSLEISENVALGAAADNGGGGIFNNGGTLNVDVSIIINNMATGASGSGGGLLSTDGDITIFNSNINGNAANRAGGAVELIDGSFTFINGDMNNNDVNGIAGTAAPGNGGGLHVSGNATQIDISFSKIDNNSAANEGGGLWNQGGSTMNVETSTVSRNTAAEGGGIYNNDGAITTVTRSTISGNNATINGGGITNDGASLDLNAVTIADNITAGTGGGIQSNTSTSLKNTLVATNVASSGTDVSGTFTSNDYNLIGTDDEDAYPEAANDLEEVDPTIGPLQDNGGLTETHELLLESVAYNAGDPADQFNDQLDQTVFEGTRDIGAFEAQTILLSIENVTSAESGIIIYPNPSRGQATMDIPATFGSNISVNIIDAGSGKLISNYNATVGSNNLDFTSLATGVYIVTVTSNDVSSVHRVIVSR